MDISPVTTRADLDDYQSVRAPAFDHDYVGLPADPVEELLPVLDTPERGGERWELYVAREAGEPVGSLQLVWPTLDNLETVNVEGVVHPDRRSNGFGRQLGEFAIARTKELGRSRVFAESASWPDRPSLSAPLLQSLGFKEVLVEVRRMIDLEAHPPQPRCEVPAGYRAVQWVDTAPEELVDGLAYLMARMSTDAPLGDMDYERENWDAKRYREKEEAAQARQRLRVATAVVADDGTVAGFTDIGVNRHQQKVAYQWETIVDPGHRGNGLGLVLKTWNHAHLGEQVPGARWVNTWNAASNSFMIRVNELLGFEVVESWSEYQLDL